MLVRWSITISVVGNDTELFTYLIYVSIRQKIEFNGLI